MSLRRGQCLRSAGICAVAFLAGLSLARPAAAQLVANGKTLTATTTNAVATFTGADLVGFVNTITGETYLKKPSAGELAWVDTMTAPPPDPFQTSNWTIGTESGTGLPLATMIVHDSVRTLTLTIKIDPASQEIVLRISATATAAGLRGAWWTIAGLDLANGRWIVPAHTGIAFDRSHPGLGAFLEYPNTWHAQMAVYEAALGSFVLYSTDSQFYSKRLSQNTRGDTSLDVSVVTQAVAPFPSATTVPQVEWRLKAFAGDWRVAATTYRNWLAANRPPVSNAAHPWVSNIRAVVGMNAPLDPSVLTPLAAALVPSQTLLYLIDWRQTNYDVNYPDYTPRAGVAAFVSAAHALGFKVMLHTDLIGVSPGNPDYQALNAYQVRGPQNLELWGWQWDSPPSTPTRFAYINPASSTYRSTFIARVGAAIAALGADALHLDISGPMYNDGNGPIEGRTFSQGSAQLHQDLIAAFPGIALGGEGENDVLYRYHSFAQAWFFGQDAEGPGHPMATFLFSPQVEFYGHLGQPSPRDPSFAQYLVKLERRAILPRLGVGSSVDLDTTDARNARLIGMQQSWQSHAFQPAWTADWTGAVVKYQGLASTTAALTDSPTLMTLTAAGSTLFQLTHDANQIATGSFIPSWPAFDGGHIYGLDPTKLYFLESIPRPATTHITSLPQGVQLGAGTLIGSGFAHVELVPSAVSAYGFQGHLIDAHTGVRYQGVDTPLGNGATVFPSSISAGGIRRSGLSIQPPFLGQIGGETFAEFLVPVPANATMRFSVGIDDGAACTDGVTFRVTANGFELWRQNVTRGAWQDIVLDLALYGGATTTLRIISNPGAGNNPNCDWALWSDPSIVASFGSAPVSVPLSLASGSVISGFDGNGSLTSSSSTATVANVPLPGAFTLFTQPGTVVSSGANLASLPFNVWGSGRGTPAVPGSVFTDGTVGPATSGGITKTTTIFAHPPDNGTTVLSWVLSLPNSSPLRLGASVGIADGGFTSDGVDFQIRINGVQYWHLTTLANQWFPAAVDLGRWKGQNVLVELVTDSLDTFNFDWAYWADLVLTASGTSCAYAVPPAASVGAFGGTFSANVTATPECTWLAGSNVPWLTIASGSGLGNGAISYVVAPNVGAARTGILTVGGQTITINQAATSVVTNAPPTVSGIPNVGGRRNTPIVVPAVVGDPIGGAAAVVLSATSSNGALVPNANISAGGSGANRTLTIVPAANQVGSTMITVTASARGFNASTLFRLTVHAMGPAGDFDGDLRSDIGVYRPSNGAWYFLKSSSAFNAGAGYAWGAAGDVPLLGDFDGDGKADITVYRPATAYWFVLRSTTNYSTWGTYQWGTSGDMPVPGDYDGDGKTDIAVYRPSNGTWYILLSSTGFNGGVGYAWGAAGDVPLPGDYDGDGRIDLAVYRPSSGHWFIKKSTTNFSTWDTYQWGSTGDVQVPADYDGDGRTDIAVYRPSNGTWYILLSSTGFVGGAGYAWGIPGDVPVPGDFDGDGQTDIAVYRASTANWFILTSTSGYMSWLTYQWGSSGDIPLR